MNDENDRLRAYVEERRGRPLTLAERNIDIAGLNRDLQDGKQAIRDAVAKAQADAARAWVRRGMRGDPRLRVTPEMEKLIGELYDKGAEHASGELGRAGVRGYATPTRDGKRMAKLLTQLATLLGGVNARMRKTAAELDLSTLSRNAIAEALAKVPGALDVASRMVSPAMYAGLGATFDKAAAQIDVGPAMTLEDALTYYHSPKAFELNDALRKGKLTTEQRSVVKTLDDSFKPAERDLVLWRGVPHAPDVYGGETDALKRGLLRKVSTPGYLSTSQTRSTALDFAAGIAGEKDEPAIERLVIREGTPILNVPAGDYGDQQEILLPRDIEREFSGASTVANPFGDPPTIPVFRGATTDEGDTSGEVDEPAPSGGGNGWEYTAVMDGSTCDPCAEHEGDTFDTWDAAQDVLPDGGPNPDCDGDTRCRCRLAPVPLG